MAGVAYILLLVALAYGFFFAYDVLSVKASNTSRGYMLFALGFVLNTLAAAVFLYTQVLSCPWDAIAFVAITCSVACLVLMVWALFFSLPKGTYADPKKGRPVYDKGMYALCRHPGVLWYCGAFLFAALAFRTLPAVMAAAILCAGNLAYMLFQDLWSFPRIFSNYEDYRMRVPFFLPTATSFRRAFCDAAAGGESQ